MRTATRLLVITLLCALAMSATVYQYPISGNSADPADEKILIVDTESKDFADRITWISERAGLLPPKVRDYINVSPGAAGGNPTSEVSITVFGQACWSKNELQTCIDVRAIATGPEGPMHCLVWLNIALGLGKDTEALGHLRYEPPRPPAPVDDCMTAGAPCGEHLPGQPGRYKSRNLGRKVGDRWTGPSGAVYELRNGGGVFWFPVWVRL